MDEAQFIEKFLRCWWADSDHKSWISTVYLSWTSDMKLDFYAYHFFYLLVAASMVMENWDQWNKKNQGFHGWFVEIYIVNV